MDRSGPIQVPSFVPLPGVRKSMAVDAGIGNSKWPDALCRK